MYGVLDGTDELYDTSVRYTVPSKEDSGYKENPADASLDDLSVPKDNKKPVISFSSLPKTAYIGEALSITVKTNEACDITYI